MKRVFVALILLTLASCTDEIGARKTLERNNYKIINVGGYAWFGGSNNDLYCTKFKAIAPNGDTVTGMVTKGLFKGNTIRLND